MKYITPLTKRYNLFGMPSSVTAERFAEHEKIKLTDCGGVFFVLKTIKRKDGLFTMILTECGK